MFKIPVIQIHVEPPVPASGQSHLTDVSVINATLARTVILVSILFGYFLGENRSLYCMVCLCSNGYTS